MIPVKRLEIVVDQPHAELVTALLAEHGISGWTQMSGAAGSGERGRQLGDDLTGVSSNCVILTTCRAEQLEGLIEALRRVLAAAGGACLVSDALWLRH